MGTLIVAADTDTDVVVVAVAVVVDLSSKTKSCEFTPSVKVFLVFYWL